MIIFKLVSDKDNYKAEGIYNFENNEMTVLKGSIVSAEVPYISTFNSNGIIAKRNEYVKDNKVVKDVKFSSPSTAASFITGRSANGLTAWKSENGTKLKELIKKKG